LHIVDVGVGDDFVCGLLSNGSVYCFGDNGYDQLHNGYGTTATPMRVLDLKPAKVLAVGGGSSCVLLRTGQVSCWGDGSSGQRGCVGVCPQPDVVGDLRDVALLGVGGDLACVARRNREVECWGTYYFGPVPNSITYFNVPTPVMGFGDVTVVAFGLYDNACAIGDDERVYCWGDDLFGGLGDGTTVSRFDARPVPNISGAKAVSTSTGAAIVLLENGELWGWGNNKYGVLGQGARSPDPVFAPVRIGGIGPATAISLGGYFACALVDADAWCWGENGDGQLGDGTRTAHFLPGKVEGLPPIAKVSAGADSACALGTDGDVFCWGDNEHGMVGLDEPRRILTPHRVDVLGAAKADLRDAGAE
jgi:alpha-tubulin suppressor-like RCC1 family protein